jgi:hypothetical protein
MRMFLFIWVLCGMGMGMDAPFIWINLCLWASDARGPRPRPRNSRFPRVFSALDLDLDLGVLISNFETFLHWIKQYFLWILFHFLIDWLSEKVVK